MGNQQTRPIEENDPQKKKREQIIEEILQTERSYANYMCVIEDLYIEPMTKKSIVKKESLAELFSTIQPIIQFHRDFFQELAICYNSFNWASQPIPLTRTTTNDDGTTVTTTTISKPSPTAKKPQTSLESTIAITDIFNKHKARSDSTSNGQDLNSLLIMPVQRLPRYVLLLTELLKSTPAGHANIKILETCISNIKAVTSFINEAKRDDENQSKAKEFQDGLIDKVLTGECSIHSMYPVKEEEAIIKRIHKHRKTKSAAKVEDVFPEEFKLGKDYTFCIFNDCFLLMSKPPKSSISNLLNSSKVWTINDCSLLKSTKIIDVLNIFDFKHCVLLSTERSCYFIQFSNAENKDKFIKTIAFISKIDWKKSMAVTDANLAQTTSNAYSNLPSVLTLRPTAPTRTTTSTTTLPMPRKNHSSRWVYQRKKIPQQQQQQLPPPTTITRRNNQTKDQHRYQIPTTIY
ncbi:pleckstrin domain-containing protein [Heterostelium album PN500]|uniref:Pleckstrin domain-containing protein n=1 Tax=Heterostelium pallidum (strain ATCC 26659 / Pp 5 / PN500) TaxID=670386 RepID=D3BIS3_HETP5|nr:pleckstrin domain-containing protein [Heterostelium album PN500]EFA78697.1 pleckstrin domain-containing protein [Heterostelium album PN500]|eukprot:XP_020430821.1 pleckstrin domain-containing protein [Heterostelium album PN500]